MAGPFFYDRVMETSTTTGTGTLTLAGAVTGFQTWAAVGNSNTGNASLIVGVDANGNPSGQWEINVNPVYTSSGTTLSRGTFASSSTGSAVSFSAGTKYVALIEFPAAHANQFCSVYNSANQSFTSGAVTAITMDTEASDISGMHSTSSNTDRINILVAGTYSIHGEVEWAANAVGGRAAYLVINHDTTNGILAGTRGPNNGADINECSVSAIAALAAGDFVSLYGFQGSGGNLNAQADGIRGLSLQVARIGP